MKTFTQKLTGARLLFILGGLLLLLALAIVTDTDTATSSAPEMTNSQPIPALAQTNDSQSVSPGRSVQINSMPDGFFPNCASSVTCPD